MDENDKIIGGVKKLDPEDETSAGYKTTNPNVASHSNMNGAYAAWGTSEVYVWSIGGISIFGTAVPAVNLLLLRKRYISKRYISVIPAITLLLSGADEETSDTKKSSIVATSSAEQVASITASYILLEWSKRFGIEKARTFLS